MFKILCTLLQIIARRDRLTTFIVVGAYAYNGLSSSTKTEYVCCVILGVNLLAYLTWVLWDPATYGSITFFI